MLNVKFGKNGFYHPAYGRLGRGGNKGKIYMLPDFFGERITRIVDVMDHTSKPPRKVDEKEITQYKYLPSSAVVYSEEDLAELKEEAEAAGEEFDKPVRAKVTDQDELDRVTGRGTITKPQGAIERTTGEKPKKKLRSRRAAVNA